MGNNTIQKINGNFKNKSIFSIDQFSPKDINIVFKTADKYKKMVLSKGGNQTLKGRIASALFFEPSSRTFGSFIAAMQRLGGGFIPFQGMESSSVSKGESLEDTIQTFASYSDIIIMRHPQVGSIQKAIAVSPVPIINAGEGIGEHPTQALYDAYTILKELGKINGLHIVFFGELGHYRPVNSLAKLLALYSKNKITFVSPPQGRVKNEIKENLKRHGIRFSEAESLDGVIEEADVLYVTRVKKEFMSEDLYKKLKGKYVVDNKVTSRMKKKSIILHALPRIDEIHTEVDYDNRAVYLRSQIRNGMYIRMALLALVLGGIK